MHQSTWMATSLKNQRKMSSERAREADNPHQAELVTKSDSNRKSRVAKERWIQATIQTSTPNSFNSRTMPIFQSMDTCQMEVPCQEWAVVPKLQPPKWTITWWEVAVTHLPWSIWTAIAATRITATTVTPIKGTTICEQKYCVERSYKKENDVTLRQTNRQTYDEKQQHSTCL